jgi:threonine/homoserine/homoserine lactone efflux protein
VAALAAAMIVGGTYLLYVSYEAIHNKKAATPITKATKALNS